MSKYFHNSFNIKRLTPFHKKFIKRLTFACAAHWVCRKVVIIKFTTQWWVLIIIIFAIMSKPICFSVITVLTLFFETDNKLEWYKLWHYKIYWISNWKKFKIYVLPVGIRSLIFPCDIAVFSSVVYLIPFNSMAMM